MSEKLEPLTQRQVAFARSQVGRWLRIKFEWEPENWSGSGREIRKWSRLQNDPAVATLPADADHSALLWRLLQGKEPLPEPPPLRYSYPDYSAADPQESEGE